MADYSVPCALESSVGVLDINPGPGLPGIHLTGLPGFDSPSVRAPIDNKPQADGAIDHVFFYGPRNWSLEGVIIGSSLADRDAREQSLKAQFHALVKAPLWTPGRFSFTPYDGIKRFSVCKPNGNLDISGSGLVKSFTMPCVAYDHVIYTYAQTSAVYSGSFTLNNTGNSISWPVFQVLGGTASITNNSYSTPKTTSIVGASGFSSYIEIIPFRGTAFADGIGADMTRYLDMSVNQYWPLLPGANNITISGSSVRILWNNGWI